MKHREYTGEKALYEVSTRLTKSQLNQVKNKIAAFGISIADYIRILLLKSEVKVE